jgi:hypothetical protein
MTTGVDPLQQRRLIAETDRRRWRLAALLGLVVLLGLAAFTIVQTQLAAQAARTTAVLEATADIRAGTTITNGVLGVTYLRVEDPAVVANLVDARDRARLVGEVATDNVRAGSLISIGLGTPSDTVTMWEVPLPVKRMPADLRAGDHVALLVDTTAKSGAPIEFAAMQDVRVLDVRSGAADLWLPATTTAQMQWYADHGGGIVLARMQPGTVQQDLRSGGAG